MKTKRKCVECGKVHNMRSNQKYCSRLCINAHARRNMRIISARQVKDGTGYSWLRMRWHVLQRDDFTCQYCGRDVSDGAKLNIDHIRPKKKGGRFAAKNLITACFECNQGKKDVLPTKRQNWKYIDHKKGENPFQPCAEIY